ncbi:dUTP diphosphatase [Sporosarcina sp. FA9]|uniref:dUTP diphosphatase n=1 Tax=Sporosarcina sp. FA9 TaxID=3413030 RepID=UPI003F65CDAD
MTVKVKKLHKDAFIPTKAYVSDAGFDLHALKDVLVAPGETVVVKTGLAFEIPDGFEMQIRPRSGISSRTKLRVVLGTIDSQYRGEVGVIVDNISLMIDWQNFANHVTLINECPVDYDEVVPWETYLIKKGDRVAQAVIQKIPHVVLYEVDELSESNRGENGFGSSGV